MPVRDTVGGRFPRLGTTVLWDEYLADWLAPASFLGRGGCCGWRPGVAFWKRHFGTDKLIFSFVTLAGMLVSFGLGLLGCATSPPTSLGAESFLSSHTAHAHDAGSRTPLQPCPPPRQGHRVGGPAARWCAG